MEDEPSGETPEQIVRRALRQVDTFFPDGSHSHTSGFYEDTIPILEAGLERFPESAELHHAMGTADQQHASQIQEQAMYHYWRAIHLDPNDFMSRLFLGYRLMEMDRPEEAIACLQEALQVGEQERSRWQQASARVQLGKALLRQGDVVGARAQLQQAISLEPADDEAHTELGRLLMHQGELDAAIGHLKEAVRIIAERGWGEWDQVRARWELAKALCRKGETSEAREQLKKALEVGRPLYWEPWARVISEIEADLRILT